MNLRRTRIVMSVLFASIAAAISITPVMLWRAERVDALEDHPAPLGELGRGAR